VISVVRKLGSRDRDRNGQVLALQKGPKHSWNGKGKGTLMKVIDSASKDGEVEQSVWRGRLEKEAVKFSSMKKSRLRSV
jgi:hypothetical protein